jgi:hypothetical protein
MTNLHDRCICGTEIVSIQGDRYSALRIQLRRLKIASSRDSLKHYNF